MFPYPEEIEVKPGHFVSYKRVLNEIGPLLTEARRERIDQVVAQRNYSINIVLENIYDRGNASAVMRTAEAFGFQNFDLIEGGEKFKAANRVTMGAEKWLNVRKWKTSRDCILKLKEEGYQIVATSLEASQPIGTIDFSKRTALVLGNEKEGVSREMLDASDARVIIPMVGFVQSFNISVAGALSLYHISQDRTRRLGKNADITPEQQEILRAHYFMKTLDSAPEILLARGER